MTATTINDFLEQWFTAERAGDADALVPMAVDDFVLVGPLGFMLNKEQWINRYRSGDLKNTAWDFQDYQVRDYGDAAVVVGSQIQQTTYKGGDSSGQFRATLVLVRRAGNWALAGVHLSPIGQPFQPPAPPKERA